jgi:hypothetical protein
MEIIALAFFAFMFVIYNPAEQLGRHIKAHWTGSTYQETDATDRLTYFLCVVFYLVIWFILEVTGLRAIIANEF